TSGTVRVADAAGAPPTIPFWLGEAPARSDELSAAVSDLRREVDARLAPGGPEGPPDSDDRRESPHRAGGPEGPPYSNGHPEGPPHRAGGPEGPPCSDCGPQRKPYTD